MLILFQDKFPELAKDEQRIVTALYRNKYKVPQDDYTMLEMYCTDCDCRRVHFHINSSVHKQTVAVIEFGWESLDYYAKFVTNGKTNDFFKLTREEQISAVNMKTARLSKKHMPTEISKDVLNMIKEEALKDKKYIKRLKKHYKLIRTPFARHVIG